MYHMLLLEGQERTRRDRGPTGKEGNLGMRISLEAAVVPTTTSSHTSQGRRPNGCYHKVPCRTTLPRGKAGWLPVRRDPLVISEEYRLEKGQGARIEGIGYSTGRQESDQATLELIARGTHEFHEVDNSGLIHKRKNGRTTVLPSKPSVPKQPKRCLLEHEGPCIDKHPVWNRL